MLQVIYSGKNEANCTFRITVAGIRESKYYLTQVQAGYPSLRGSGKVSPCRLSRQSAFLLHGLQKLWHRGAGRQVLGSFAMLLPHCIWPMLMAVKRFFNQCMGTLLPASGMSCPHAVLGSPTKVLV